MRSGLRTGIVATAAVTAAVALYVSLTLPPPTIRLDVSVPPTHVTYGLEHGVSTWPESPLADTTVMPSAAAISAEWSY